MNKLMDLLTKHTQEKGSYTLDCNIHKQYYHINLEDIAQDYLGCCDKEDIEEFKRKIDLHKPIYCLTWFPRNPAGFYILYANSIEEITKELQELVNEEKEISVQN